MGSGVAATPSLPLRRLPKGPWGPGNLHSCTGPPSPAAASGISWQKGSIRARSPLPRSECSRAGLPPAAAGRAASLGAPQGKAPRRFSPCGPHVQPPSPNSLQCDHCFCSPVPPKPLRVPEPPTHHFSPSLLLSLHHQQLLLTHA